MGLLLGRLPGGRNRFNSFLGGEPMTYPEDVLKSAREAAIKVYHDPHKGDVYYDPRRYEARFRSGDCDDDYIVQSACIAIMAEREKVAALVEALRRIETAECVSDWADQPHEQMQDVARQALAALGIASANGLTLQQPLTPEICELVIAARKVAYESTDWDARKRLDRAVSAFADRVGWEDAPCDKCDGTGYLDAAMFRVRPCDPCGCLEPIEDEPQQDSEQEA